MTSKNLPALDDLAKTINEEHEACRQAMRSAVDHAVRAGELLIEAKSGIAHGEWGEWIGTNCCFSDRTARAYMRLAKELPKLDDEKRQRVAEMPLREALTLIGDKTQAKQPPETNDVVPFDVLVKAIDDPTEDMSLARLFDNFVLLLAAHEGVIETGPVFLNPAWSAKRKQDTVAEANVRCAWKMGGYLKELEKRGFKAPFTFTYWPGSVPHLDLQVLEVKSRGPVGNKKTVLRSDDDLIHFSVIRIGSREADAAEINATAKQAAQDVGPSRT